MPQEAPPMDERKVSVLPVGVVSENTSGNFAIRFSGASMITAIRKIVFQVCLLMILMIGPSFAQNPTAAVSGVVTDSTGAVVPGATVVLTRTDTGVATPTTTNSAGAYQISNLTPAVYSANVSKTGYKSEIKNAIELHVEDHASISFQLEVGSATESITVEAGQPLLETESATVSQVIEGRQVQDTPLNGRNVMNLIALTPGVVPQGATAGSPTNNQADDGAFTNGFGFNNYQIAGGLAGLGAEFLDGVPLNDLQGNSSTLIPTQDAIQEFRVESSNVNVAYGAFGGGVVSFVTKSGTNNFHGSVYEYLRNTIFDANNFFNNASGIARPKLIQNQFGATVGGPILKNHAFFFFSYEGLRRTLGYPFAGHVPTAAELSGNFTSDAPIYDPTTGHQFVCNGVLNTICPNRIDPTAQVMVAQQYFPLPNANINSNINYSVNGAAGSSADQYTARVDEAISPKQTLFARYSYWKPITKATQYIFGTNGPQSQPGGQFVTQSIALGDTYTFNPSTVANVRLSYLRNVNNILPVNNNVNLAQYGPFYGAIANQVTYKQYPVEFLTNSIPLPYVVLNVSQLGAANDYAISGNLTKTINTHTLNIGGELRRFEFYFTATNQATSFNDFVGAFTGCSTGCTTPSGAPSASSPAGSGATPTADFLLGKIAASNGFTEVQPASGVAYYGALFANDSYRVNEKLTLSYGVRWEVPGATAEKHDRNTVLLPGLSNPLQLVNSSAYGSRDDLNQHYDLFSPRVGFAFSPSGTTTVRGGYSLAFLPQASEQSGPSNSPVNAATTFVASGAQLSSPLAGGSTTLLQPLGRAYNGTQFLGGSIQSRIPYQTYPYMQQWNLNVQQSLGHDTVAGIGYIAATGFHMPLDLEINQLADQYLGLPASSLSQALRPYPEYQKVVATSSYSGVSNYQSLQASLTKRFGSGGVVTANYTWSKFLSNTEAYTTFLESNTVGGIQDYNNLHGEYSLLSFDTPNRLVISYVLDLPFGKGKAFLGNASGVVDKLVSGWGLNGITTFASGFPLAITSTANTLSNVYGAGTIRPNVVDGCNRAVGGSILSHVQQGTPVINQACFTAPGDTSFGNESRVDPYLRGESIDNWDISAVKTTGLTEKVNLVFRAEVFNLANRVQFGSPNTTSGGAQFGLISSQINDPRELQFSLRVNF
jgi:Carboxypeptidase regulatory-like domain